MHWPVLYRATAFPSTLPYLQPAAMMHAQLANMDLGVDHATKHIHSQHIVCKVREIHSWIGMPYGAEREPLGEGCS